MSTETACCAKVKDPGCFRRLSLLRSRLLCSCCPLPAWDTDTSELLHASSPPPPTAETGAHINPAVRLSSDDADKPEGSQVKRREAAQCRRRPRSAVMASMAGGADDDSASAPLDDRGYFADVRSMEKTMRLAKRRHGSAHSLPATFHPAAFEGEDLPPYPPQAASHHPPPRPTHRQSWAGSATPTSPDPRRAAPERTPSAPDSIGAGAGVRLLSESGVKVQSATNGGPGVNLAGSGGAVDVLSQGHVQGQTQGQGHTSAPTFFQGLGPVRHLSTSSCPASSGRPPGAIGPRVTVQRSISDNVTGASGRLRQVDIVGESSEARFPWQRDVAVQCDLASAASAVRRRFWSRSSSSGGGTGEDGGGLMGSGPGGDWDRPGGEARSRRPRPSSVGAVETLRYQLELARFRDSYSRVGRKSDPQLFESPPCGRKRLPMVLSDDTGSVSDLESILENPDDDDSHWESLSRCTSLASYEGDDDVMEGEGPEMVSPGVVGRGHSLEGELGYLGVLPSPTLSPSEVLTEHPCSRRPRHPSDSESSPDYVEEMASPLRERNFIYPRKTPRRLSSGSLTSGSESENEPSQPVARRGRRAAIFETKNCGDVSPTTLSPEASPSNSCDEGDGASNIAERLRRRRSSVDLSMNIYPGDLLVQEHHRKLIKRNTIADFYANSRNGAPIPPPGAGEGAVTDSKKGRQPFSLLKLMKTRSKESLSQLGDALSKLKPSEFKDNHLAAYKNLHWSDLIASSDKQQTPVTLDDTERKRREAVWELFKSECVFLVDHLMVIKHCFMEPLKKVQVDGFLMFAEPEDIFGNLDELCYVSYTFCKDFLAALLKDMSSTDFGRTSVLIKAFQRFASHSKDGAVYHTYCLNYTNALSYLEKLRQSAEFIEFEKWCCQDSRCNRLQLGDLLVAPMQHCTKLPLLLANIRKYTPDPLERQHISESIQTVETSLKQLEEKMQWVKNYERVQEIQQQLVWPPVTELDHRTYIPDCLKTTLSKQPCERLLSCTRRQLVHEGPLTLMEAAKPIDVYLFLFDDILLLTKVKKAPRKKQSGSEGDKGRSSGREGERHAFSTVYTVYRQPLALDRFALHDIPQPEAAVSGLKNAFVLVQISRFQQIIGVYTLQAPCDSTKATWVSHIRETKERYSEGQGSRQSSFKENRRPARGDETRDQNPNRSPRRVKRTAGHRRMQGKSRSMDAVFL